MCFWHEGIISIKFSCQSSQRNKSNGFTVTLWTTKCQWLRGNHSDFRLTGATKDCSCFQTTLLNAIILPRPAIFCLRLVYPKLRIACTFFILPFVRFASHFFLFPSRFVPSCGFVPFVTYKSVSVMLYWIVNQLSNFRYKWIQVLFVIRAVLCERGSRNPLAF